MNRIPFLSWALRGVAVLGIVGLGACIDRLSLSEPPNLYSVGTNFPADLVHPSLRTATPNIFYMTDRSPEGVAYGSGRSASMAFGAAQVSFGDGLSWSELLERTHFDTTRRMEQLRVQDLQERVRFRPTPLEYERVDGQLRHLPLVRAEYDGQAQAFQAAIQAEIRNTGNTRVLVYFHGFNNSLEDSVTTLANLWHFAGRQAIPIAFTWPAGAGQGPLGYFRDRDSGTFAVHHAKEFLRILAETPEVAQIDIVAHSRGNDIATTALRELIIAARGAGLAPKLALKTGTLIMAAPDLDVDIVRQRLSAERVSEAFEQVNLYINADDAALRLSAWLTGSTRLGALKDEDFLPGETAILARQALVHFIRVQDVRGNLGHSYFRDNPAVLSDIVLALRTRAFPGGTLRPLEANANGVWVLHETYPLEQLPDLAGLERKRGSEDR